MSKYIRRLTAPALIVTVALLGACSSGEKKGSDSLALGADSTLNRDLAMAGADSTAQPQLQDVPATTPAETPAPTRTEPARTTRTPSRPAPRKAEPAPSRPVVTASGNTRTTNASGSANANGGGAVGVIAAGTTLHTTAASKVCTNTNSVGDHVSATVENAVQGSNGAAIPAGATVHMTVTQLKRSENSRDNIVMEFAVNSVSFGGRTYPLDAAVESASVSRVRDEPQSKDVQKVATGALIGAIAGRIIGKGAKGTIIGGAVGAAGGAAAASATANYQGCIDQGSSIVVRLNSAATVKA